jgi:hypothetical protein
MSAQPDTRPWNLLEAVRRTNRAIRLYNLRNRAERREWERIAYEPRVDYGEVPNLKPNAHENGDYGWMD